MLIANSTFLLFDIDDFNGASVGGEWLFPLARHIEGGIGVSYSSQTASPASMRTSSIRTVPRSIRTCDLRLVPLAFTVRLIPVSPRSPLQPYIGGGVGLISWQLQ